MYSETIAIGCMVYPMNRSRFGWRRPVHAGGAAQGIAGLGSLGMEIIGARRRTTLCNFHDWPLAYAAIPHIYFFPFPTTLAWA